MRHMLIAAALTLGCSAAFADQKNEGQLIGLTDAQLDVVTAGRRNRARSQRQSRNRQSNQSVSNNASSVVTPGTLSLAIGSASATGPGSTFATSSTFVDGATAVTPLFILSTATASSSSTSCTGCLIP